MSTYVPQELEFADRAPVVVEAANVVTGTPEEVWAAILDYPGWTRWFPRISSCRATSEPATGVGSTRDVKLKGGGGTFAERFIAWDEPTTWAFTVISGPPMFTSIVERITIEPEGEGRTRVTYRMALAPRRWLAPVFGLARGQLQKVLATALRNLDAELALQRHAA